MNPQPDPESDPQAAGSGAPRSRRPPRNWLERRDHRKLFWSVMPPALVAVAGLGWIERGWFTPAPTPATPAVDTRLERVQGPRPEGDAVIIEADPEPTAVSGLEEELAASPAALARVRDDTFFRAADEDAWQQTWLTLQSRDPRLLDRASVREVGFTELFGQPRTFRGRLVRVRGTLHRLERLRAPASSYNVPEYWQGWLEPAGGPSAPIVVQFLELPPGMPHGLDIREPIECVGYFFKRYAYNARDTVRLTPLVMAARPTWKPVAEEHGGLGAVAAGTATLVVLIVIVAGAPFVVAPRKRSGPDHPSPSAAANSDGLSTLLAGFEPFSPAEALRKLAAEEGSAAAPQEPRP